MYLRRNDERNLFKARRPQTDRDGGHCSPRESRIAPTFAPLDLGILTVSQRKLRNLFGISASLAEMKSWVDGRRRLTAALGLSKQLYHGADRQEEPSLDSGEF
jgi:hypothetical protein